MIEPRGVPDRIDWTDVRRRVEAAGAAIRGTQRRSPEEVRALLRQRAARLAVPEDTAAEGESLEVLICVRGGESWAVETRFVTEVMRLGTATPLPGADPDVFGVTAWRGEPLLLRELGASSAPAADAWVVALGEERRAAFGLVVDAPPRLALMPVAAVRPPPPAMGLEQEWLRGITEDAVLVVDGGALIHSRIGGSPS